MSTQRLDAALVARGIVRSRAQAKELLDAGRIRVDGAVESKASTKVGDDADLSVVGEIDHYVGRAAHKLIAAFEAFPDVAARVDGVTAIDVGASTGGFTQVLLEHGAAHVIALDVGHGQLAEPVASDPRVTDLEGLNIRDVISADQLEGSPYPLVVSDLSFISLRLALPHMRFLLADGGDMVVLIKPQFEVGRERLGRTGIVSSVEQRRESIERVLECANGLGLRARGLAWSPMVGSHGNHEYLLWLRHDGESDGDGLGDADLETLIEHLTRRSEG